MIVEFGAGADLGDFAVLHQGDAVGDGQGFFLIVGDVDSGESRGFADAADFGAHVVAELGVEIAEGFVEEETVGADGQGAGEGDALLLAAGQSGGFAVGEFFHLDQLEGFLETEVSLGAGRPRMSRPKDTFWLTVRCGQRA